MNEGILRAITQSSNSSSTPETDKLQAAMYKKALAAQNFAIKQAKDRSKINFNAQIKADAEVQALIAGITLKDEDDKDFNSGIDINTLPNSLKSMTSSLSSAKVRVANGTATQEDKDYISATTVFIGNLGESFGTMAYTLEEYKKTNEKYGGQIDTPGAVDQYTLNPNYANSVRILDGSASGKVFFEIEYKNGKQNLTQVAQSEDIRKENKRLYDLSEGTEEKKQYLNENGEISDKYKLSYNKARDFQNNQNQNEFVISDEFSTIPDGNTVTKALTEEGGIYDKSNGLLKKDFMKPIPTQQIRTINGQRVVIDKTSPDVNLISSRAKIEAQVFTRKMFGGARNEPFSAFTRVSAPIFGKEGKDWQLDKEGNYNVRLLKKDVDGNYEMNEDGTYKKESKLTKIGSKDLTNARFNMMSSVGGKYLGMSKEDYDLANRFVQDASMINLNLTQASTEKINEDATKKLNEETKIPSIAEQKQSLINQRTSNIISKIGSSFEDRILTGSDQNKVKEFNTYLKDQIQGIKGYDVFASDGDKTYQQLLSAFAVDALNKRRIKDNLLPVKLNDKVPIGNVFFSISTGKGETVDTERFSVISPKSRESLALYLETIRATKYGKEGQSVLELLSGK
tara:strand:- start:2549 stop:4423 length:1875 start_codon:yes stop_codon:yes gene_type:complete